MRNEWQTVYKVIEWMRQEELSGTYFYHGQSNLSAGELFDVIFIEQFFVMNLGLALSQVLLSSPGNRG